MRASLIPESEAKLVNDFTIQPLTQTLEELIDEYEKGLKKLSHGSE